jgi:hypothetical protein
MATNSELPFQNLARRQWLNLGVAALLAFYLFYTVWEVRLGTLCGQLGVDYCDYWSAGKVANTFGYSRIYDLNLLDRVQKSILPISANPAAFQVVPFPYLPVFVAPFQLLSLLTPAAGFWIWTAANTLLFLWYLRFFSLRLLQQPAPSRLLLVLLVSLPVYLNIYSGQVNALLAICVGEFLRGLMEHRLFRAGLWLGGLVLKPQLLVLMGLILVLRRSARILAGLAAAVSTLGLISLLLATPHGLASNATLLLNYASGRASVWVEAMMNWRMLGFHVASIIGPGPGWAIAGGGMLVTLLVVVRTWGFSPNSGLPLSPSAVLGVFAATTAFAWHSHVPMAVVLIPPILYLYHKGQLSEKTLAYWILVPAVFFCIVVFAPEAVARFSPAHPHEIQYVYFLIGAGELAVNLYLLWWAAKRSALTANP